MNYYELLEISSSASVEVIRNAYKTLAKKYHPDTYRGDISFAEEKMKLLNEAVSVLENEAKRKEYNKLNGINPMSQSGYSDYGRNNMINVDENGEPIFFSYDAFEEEDANDSEDSGGFGKSYMDIIDDFIKNSKLERKSKRKAAKNKEPKETVADVDDISEINIENPVHGDIEFQYDNPDARSEPRFGDEPEFDPEPEIDNEPDFRTFNFRGRQKPKPKSRNLTLKTRLYYIVVAFLITLIVVFFILIMQSLNLENIKELMRGFSGNSNSNANDLYVFEDNTTSDDNPYAADIPEPFIVIEAIEDDYTEPTQSALEENNSLLENVVKTAEATTQNQLNTKPTVKPPAPLPTETRRPPAPTQTPTQPPTVKNETTAEPFIEVTTSEDLTEPGVDIEITTEPTIITDEPTIETEPPSEVESPEPIIDIETDAPTILANPEEYAPEEER